MNLPGRFIDENLAPHWQVDQEHSSFKRMIAHLRDRTNFLSYYQEAISKLDLHKGCVIADIGAGVGWTSALLAKREEVARVYAIEPNRARRERIPAVVEHFGVEHDKVLAMDGSFQGFSIPEKIDGVLLCAALHHCYDRDLGLLFDNIRSAFREGSGGRRWILIANEHYTTKLWVLHRLCSKLISLLPSEESKYYRFLNPRAPNPDDGEHWRSRRQLLNIFRQHADEYRIFVHSEDLCKDKPPWLSFLEFRYYHALLWI